MFLKRHWQEKKDTDKKINRITTELGENFHKTYKRLECRIHKEFLQISKKTKQLKMDKRLEMTFHRRKYKNSKHIKKLSASLISGEMLKIIMIYHYIPF